MANSLFIQFEETPDIALNFSRLPVFEASVEPTDFVAEVSGTEFEAIAEFDHVAELEPSEFEAEIYPTDVEATAELG